MPPPSHSCHRPQSICHRHIHRRRQYRHIHRHTNMPILALACRARSHTRRLVRDHTTDAQCHAMPPYVISSGNWLIGRREEGDGPPHLRPSGAAWCLLAAAPALHAWPPPPCWPTSCCRCRAPAPSSTHSERRRRAGIGGQQEEGVGVNLRSPEGRGHGSHVRLCGAGGALTIKPTLLRMRHSVARSSSSASVMLRLPA